MKVDSFQKLYLEELRDVYSAETQLLKALPKLAAAASYDELKQALEDHFEQTKEHVERLEEIFKRLDQKSAGKTCEGMSKLIEEATKMAHRRDEAFVIDCGLISATHRIEHYEIAAYGSLRSFANFLGEEEAAELLQETLDEENEADKLLAELAETIVYAETPAGRR